MLISKCLSLILAASLAVTSLHAQWTTTSSGIYYGGNVGLGTTTPTAKLNIANGNLTVASDANTTPATWLNIFGNSFLACKYGTAMHFGTNTDQGLGTYADVMNISGAGVGIGAGVTPTHMLDVAGTVGITGNTVISAGTLAVNTTTMPAGYQMAVNGQIEATGLVVKLYANWPDFVFHKTYHLSSLDSVKSYIETNHHLQGIPTADSVERNGINLGENQALLLQKIEELTLYSIQQNQEQTDQKKQIDNLITQNQLLKEEVEALKKIVEQKKKN